MKVNRKFVPQALPQALAKAELISKHPTPVGSPVPDLDLGGSLGGFLRLEQVLTHVIPVSRSSWYEGVARGVYPKPVSLGLGRAMGYRKSDIKALVEKLSQGADHE